jgi:hypothetical protein
VVGVDPGSGGRAAERDLADAGERVGDPRSAEPDLRGESVELLPERDGDGVHEMRTARLHVAGELLAPGREGLAQGVERRKQVAGDLAERREVDSRREDVVRGLAHVDVVVWVSAVAGEVRDHLVRVHVRRGSRAGLEHVDGELVVVLAGGDLVTGRRDPLRELRVELA